MISVRFFSIILIFIVCPSLASGQSSYYPVTIPYLSSTKISENFSDGLNGAFNPAIIPYIKGIEAGMYAEKKYLTDINLLVLSVCTSFSNNGIGLLFQHFGNTLFNERTFGLNYAKSFGKASAGILIQNIRINISGSAAISMIQTGISSTLKMSDNVYAGIKIINPKLITKAGEDRIHPASSFSLMIGWQASAVVYAGMESKKEEGHPLSIIFTLLYQFAENFSGGLNWSTSGNQPFVCIGWKLKQMTIEAGCSYHATLGPSPALMLIYKTNSAVK